MRGQGQGCVYGARLKKTSVSGPAGGRSFVFFTYLGGLVGKYCSFFEEKKNFFLAKKKKKFPVAPF